LAAVCDKFAIRAVAEELDQKLLASLRVAETPARRIATRLGLPHTYCDPSRAERLKLGTTTEGEIRFEAKEQGWTDAETNERLAAHSAIREKVWLERIIKLDTWPVLLVCGADHVPTFSRRAAEQGCKVALADADWGA
jgi:hypothetical protein